MRAAICLDSFPTESRIDPRISSMADLPSNWFIYSVSFEVELQHLRKRRAECSLPHFRFYAAAFRIGLIVLRKATKSARYTSLSSSQLVTPYRFEITARQTDLFVVPSVSLKM